MSEVRVYLVCPESKEARGLEQSHPGRGTEVFL